jgi:hypothetical protein
LRASASRRFSFRSGAPYLVPAALAALAALALWHWRERLSAVGASLEGADAQIRRALANQTRARLDDVYGFRSGGTLELSPVRFAEVAASVEGERATVVALLDAEGRATWRDGSAAISYVGREKFHMRPCAISLWCAEGDQFDRLRGVLLVAFRRADAFNARDSTAYASLVSDAYRDAGLDRDALLRRIAADLAGGPAARVRILGWQIRAERETAEIGEDYVLEIAGREPRTLRARYSLSRDGARWRIASGL